MSTGSVGESAELPDSWLKAWRVTVGVIKTVVLGAWAILGLLGAATAIMAGGLGNGLSEEIPAWTLFVLTLIPSVVAGLQLVRAVSRGPGVRRLLTVLTLLLVVLWLVAFVVLSSA